MQTSLKLEQSSKGANGRVRLTADRYFKNTKDTWSFSNVLNTIKAATDKCSYDTVLASEWKLMQSTLIRVLEDRRILEDTCDFLLLGSGWENDESHLRHLSIGNFPTTESGESFKVEDMNANLLSNTVEISSYDLARDVADTAKKLICESNNCDRDHPSYKEIYADSGVHSHFLTTRNDEVVWWKYISGAYSDWDVLFEGEEAQDVMDMVNNDIEKFPHSLVSQRIDDDSLFCMYIVDGCKLKLQTLGELYITEPQLVLSGSNQQISWNC